MTRRVGTPSLIWHHLRSRPAGALSVAALVLVLSILAAATPLGLTLLADAALRDRLASLGPLDRDVEALTPGLPQFGGDGLSSEPDTSEVWNSFTRALERVRAAADAPADDLLLTAQSIAFSRDNPVLESPRTRELTLAYDPAYEEHIRVTEGRMPAAPVLVELENGNLRATPTEVVLSTTSAAEMEWAVGDTRTLGSDASETDVVLTGTFEPVDAESAYWQHVPSVLIPNILDDGNGPRRVTGTAFAHPAALPAAYELPGAQSTLVWHALQVDRIDAASAPDAVASLRKFTSVSHPVGSSAAGAGILSIRYSADVIGPVELALAQHASTSAVLAMIIAGPIGVAVAVLILGCRLMVERRRAGLRLLSARGAATGQVRGLLGIEGFFVGVVPALLGAAAVAAAGGAWVDAVPPASAALPIALLGLAPIAILAVLAGSTAERQARADLGGRGSRLRLIAEGSVLVLTIVAVALLFVRGYGTADLDPLQAATPLLLSLVACLITLRLYPLPLRRVLERTRRGPGITGFLGAARALREPTIGLTHVLALVVGVSVAVSSGILLSTLQGGITEAARAQVGADLRITGGTFTGEQLERVRAVDGVAAATGISGADPAILDVDGVKRSVWVFVVDAADLSMVQGTDPGLLPPGVALEGAGTPTPLVVSTTVAEQVDGEDELVLGPTPVEVVGIIDGPTPLGNRANWVVLDSASAEEVLGRDPSDRTVLVRLEDGAATAPPEEELRNILGAGIRVDEVDQVVADIEVGPAVQGVRTALVAATGVTALLSALALLMTLSLAAPARARVLALLQTLGFPPRAASSLSLWEIGPPAIAAAIAGTLFGALMPLVVLAAVDMRPFTGSSVQPAYRVDIATLAVTMGGFIGSAALLTAVALLVARRVRAASVLRTVEEG